MDPFLLFMLHVYQLCLVCSLQPCEYLLGKGPGLTSWLSDVLCFLVFLSLSHMVFRARYRFLSLVFLSTLCVSKTYFSLIKNVWESSYSRRFKSMGLDKQIS